jgi:hypothetical protein
VGVKMERNVRCPSCNANGFHLHRVESGKYILKCMRTDGCERQFEEKDDKLMDLSN